MFNQLQFLYTLISVACAIATAFAQQTPSLRGARNSFECSKHPISGLYGPYGIDMEGQNSSMAPGNNFFNYAGGRYLADVKIPADKSSWGVFAFLDEEVQKQVRQQLETASARGTKVGMLYSSFMNEAQVEKLGASPLHRYLERLKMVDSSAGLASLAGESSSSFFASPFDLGIAADDKDPDSYVIRIGQAGLGLPDRSYYLDPNKSQIKQAYRVHIATLLKLVDWPNVDSSASSVLALEDRIANVSWSEAQMRDIDATYNAVSGVDGLKALAPGFDWGLFLDTAGVTQALHNGTKIIVGALSAVVGIAKIVDETEMSVLKSWAAVHLARSAAIYLSKDFTEAMFAMSAVLQGTKEMPARWQKANAVLTNYMGDAVGEAYVHEHFPPASKASIEELVQNLKTAFAARIGKLEWMSISTKAKALEKLEAMASHVGYPHKFENYTDLTIAGDDLFGNILRCRIFHWKASVEKLGRPVDREKWGMPPHVVNAFYDPSKNAIFFPAAILQPPFFNPNASDAVNYGAMGAIIGHEMTHGFDDQGRLFDLHGKRVEWWTDVDRDDFESLVRRYDKQFASYTVDLPAGAHINAELTAGENIADLGGLNIAMDAYMTARKLAPHCNLESLAQSVQTFFLAWAQNWREVRRPRALLLQLSNDPHSPAAARANVPTSNMDAWYKAFNVSDNGVLFRALGERVQIW